MTLRNSLFVLSALVVIWTAVAAILRATEKHTSTPEKVLGLMATAPWLNGDESETARKKRLDEVIDQINRLDYDQRKSAREDDAELNKRFMNSLTKEERGRFLQETVEHHFQSVMKAFNKMSREERQRIVQQSIHDMEKNPAGDRDMQKLKEEDKKVFDVMVEKGLGAYYQDASTDTKMDLEPLMEKMQQRIRNLGHH